MRRRSTTIRTFPPKTEVILGQRPITAAPKVPELLLDLFSYSEQIPYGPWKDLFGAWKELFKYLEAIGEVKPTPGDYAFSIRKLYDRMIEEGVFRERYFMSDRWIDEHCYRLLRTEWEEQNAQKQRPFGGQLAADPSTEH